MELHRSQPIGRQYTEPGRGRSGAGRSRLAISRVRTPRGSPDNAEVARCGAKKNLGRQLQGFDLAIKSFERRE